MEKSLSGFLKYIFENGEILFAMQLQYLSVTKPTGTMQY
jgi:hypothetical protein